MADLDVVPRRRGWWRWALLLLFLLLVGWLVWVVLRGRERWLPDPTPELPPAGGGAVVPAAPAAAPPPEVSDTLPTVPELPAAVAEYVEVCGTAGSNEDPSLGGCLDRLTSALEEVVRRDTVGSAALEPRLERFRELAAAAGDDTTAAAMRPPLAAAAELLAAVQQARRFPALGLDEQLRAVARDARQAPPRSFFMSSAEALRLMY